ncbi:MAG: DUF7144 family membrane protein [Stackebrandtia sp.]
MTTNDTRQAWAVGGTVFAATAILVIGCFQVIMGVSALFEDEIFVDGPNYTYAIDITGWGWIHLILGVIMMLTGIFLYTASVWARGVGIALAVMSAVSNFFFLPYYPLWSIVVIALDIFAIWALATVLTPAASLPPSQSDASAPPRTQSQDWSHVNAPKSSDESSRPGTGEATSPETTGRHAAEP